MIDNLRDTFDRKLTAALNFSKGGILMNITFDRVSMDSGEGGVGFRVHDKDDEVEVEENTSNILMRLLYRTPGMPEIEVHQLAYQLDVFTVEQYGDSILQVEYTPDHHGVYSSEISMTLQKLSEDGEIQAIADMYDGEIIASYDRTEVIEMDENKSRIVDYVLYETDQYNLEELIDENREHWARKNTEFGEVIDFDEYKEKVESGEIEAVFNTSDENLPDSL